MSMLFKVIFSFLSTIFIMNYYIHFTEIETPSISDFDPNLGT